MHLIKSVPDSIRGCTQTCPNCPAFANAHITHQHRENQRHNVNRPCGAETGEHGETEVVPQREALLGLSVLQDISATLYGGSVGVHGRVLNGRTEAVGVRIRVGAGEE